MKRAAIQGRFKAIKNNFIFITHSQFCYAYPLSELREIRCANWGSRNMDFSKPFEKMFNGKSIRLIFKEE